MLFVENRVGELPLSGVVRPEAVLEGCPPCSQQYVSLSPWRTNEMVGDYIEKYRLEALLHGLPPPEFGSHERDAAFDFGTAGLHRLGARRPKRAQDQGAIAVTAFGTPIALVSSADRSKGRRGPCF
jgi:hypothetical protein